jgi:hypothetical protein
MEAEPVNVKKYITHCPGNSFNTLFRAGVGAEMRKMEQSQ